MIIKYPVEVDDKSKSCLLIQDAGGQVLVERTVEEEFRVEDVKLLKYISRLINQEFETLGIKEMVLVNAGQKIIGKSI